MFVGVTGVQRVVERTARLMAEHDTEDVLPYGGIPLPIIQRYLNAQFSISLDLFGSELSTNAAAYYSAGLKGRWMETRRKDDHVLVDAERQLTRVLDGRFVTETVPLLNALNLDLRDEYVADCETGVKRWNKVLDRAGLPHRLVLPHEGFNRRVGVYAGVHVSPDGQVLEEADWLARQDDWLPTPEDRRAVASLMRPQYERGTFASWIAPPAHGINDMGVEFDYVRFWRQDN